MKLHLLRISHTHNGPTVKARHYLVLPTERDGDLQNSGIIKDNFVTTNLNYDNVIFQITDAVLMPSVDTMSWNNRTKEWPFRTFELCCTSRTAEPEIVFVKEALFHAVETWTDTWHLFSFFQNARSCWIHGRWYGTWLRSVVWSRSSWLSAALNAVALSVWQERLSTRPLLVLSIWHHKCWVGPRKRLHHPTISLRHHLMTHCAMAVPMSLRISVGFILYPSTVKWWHCLIRQAPRLLNPGNSNTCLNSNHFISSWLNYLCVSWRPSTVCEFSGTKLAMSNGSHEGCWPWT
jgi:hypothetical protein